MMYVPALRVLGLLLLADGACVPARALRASSMHCVMAQSTLKDRLVQSKRAGCQIERRGGGRTLRYRLVALPPDSVLDDLLVVVRVLRSEAYKRPAPIPSGAPGSGIVPFVRRLPVTVTRSGASSAVASGW